MTEAAATVSAVDDDPSLQEARQRLIRSMGLRVATWGSTPEVLTGKRPNTPGGSVAYFHAPSLSDILPSIINGVTGSTVGEEGRTGPDASCSVRRPGPRITQEQARAASPHKIGGKFSNDPRLKIERSWRWRQN
jgi:hypothetical protein